MIKCDLLSLETTTTKKNIETDNQQNRRFSFTKIRVFNIDLSSEAKDSYLRANYLLDVISIGKRLFLRVLYRFNL